jgi:hypothetical protein
MWFPAKPRVVLFVQVRAEVRRVEALRLAAADDGHHDPPVLELWVLQITP